MTSNILSDKGFRSELDSMVIESKDLIAKVRKHIEEDGCRCCKRAILGADPHNNDY